MENRADGSLQRPSQTGFAQRRVNSNPLFDDEEIHTTSSNFI